jgi:hypothetical protein
MLITRLPSLSAIADTTTDHADQTIAPIACQRFHFPFTTVLPRLY